MSAKRKFKRNALCSCGSGKKFKKCCGRADKTLDDIYSLMFVDLIDIDDDVRAELIESGMTNEAINNIIEAVPGVKYNPVRKSLQTEPEYEGEVFW